MKRLSIFVVLVALIISCNSTGNDSPYPIKIGAWQLNSETEAVWIGDLEIQESLTSKAKGDTLTLSSPEGTFMQFTSSGEFRETGELPIGFIYADTTLNESIAKEWEIAVPRTKLYIKGIEAGARPFRINRRIPSVNAQALTMTMEFLYTCNQPISGSDDMKMEFYTENDSLVQVKILNTEGVQTVLDQEFCGS